jgi:hypothetical protein
LINITESEEKSMKADNSFWRDLKQNRQYLTKQQYRTIKGQAVKGQINDARKGLKKIINRRGN